MRTDALTERVRAVLARYIREVAGGNCAAVAKAARCRVGTFYEWIYGKTPQIENLLQAWYHLNLPVSLIFSTDSDLSRGIRGQAKIKAENEQKVRTKRTRKQLQSILQAVKPIFQQAIKENPPPPIHEVCKRIGLSPELIKEYDPTQCERLKIRRREYTEACRAQVFKQLKAALHEAPPPVPNEIYGRLGITQSIAIHNFPDLRRAIIVRYRQYLHQQSCARQETALQEIRDLVRKLDKRGVCPSVTRVWSLAKKKSFLKWRVFAQAVHDARKTLHNNQAHQSTALTIGALDGHIMVSIQMEGGF
jgi:hypothetical protein